MNLVFYPSRKCTLRWQLRSAAQRNAGRAHGLPRARRTGSETRAGRGVYRRGMGNRRSTAPPRTARWDKSVFKIARRPVEHRTTPHRTTPHHITPHHTTPHHTILHHSASHRIAPHRTASRLAARTPAPTPRRTAPREKIAAANTNGAMHGQAEKAEPTK